MFLFFGWGTKSKFWKLENATLVCKWNYFHLFFLPIAGKKSWYLINENRNEDRELEYQEVMKIKPDAKIGVFNQYGLLIGFCVIGIWAIIVSLFNL
jgi:hypothetical protein